MDFLTDFIESAKEQGTCKTVINQLSKLKWEQKPPKELYHNSRCWQCIQWFGSRVVYLSLYFSQTTLSMTKNLVVWWLIC